MSSEYKKEFCRGCFFADRSLGCLKPEKSCTRYSLYIDSLAKTKLLQEANDRLKTRIEELEHDPHKFCMHCGYR